MSVDCLADRSTEDTPKSKGRSSDRSTAGRPIQGRNLGYPNRSTGWWTGRPPTQNCARCAHRSTPGRLPVDRTLEFCC